MLSALLGGIIGGAIGGAIISTVSYAVSCVLSGEQMNGSGLANAVNTGAVSGALGGAIGGITAASKMAEFVAKGIASAGLGLGIGIKTSMETEGTMDQRKWKGRVTGIATFGATFAGSLLKVDTDFFGAMFVNYHTALFFGTPVEVVSVAAQKMISKPKESKAQSVSAVKRTGLSNAGRVAQNYMAANKPGRGTPSGFWTSTDYYYLYYGGKAY